MKLFKRKVNGMPVEGEGWTASSWATAPKRTLPVKQLISTNRNGYLNLRKVAQYGNGGGALPWVVDYGGSYYVADGHHRVAAAAKRGDKTITVRVKRNGDR